MTQNFRSSGFVTIAEMSHMQSMHRTLLSTILSSYLMCKFSCDCHEIKIYISVIPWQWPATGCIGNHFIGK